MLFLETSEEMPSATEVYRILRCMGERDLLGQFGAVLLGRPKAWSPGQPAPPIERDTYQAGQRAAVLRALAQYAPQTMAVFDVDLGHTDPQLVIPYGGMVRGRRPRPPDHRHLLSEGHRGLDQVPPAPLPAIIRLPPGRNRATRLTLWIGHGPVFQYVMPGNCSRARSSWPAHSRGQPKARAAWPLMSAAAAPLVKWTYSPQFIRRV